LRVHSSFTDACVHRGASLLDAENARPSVRCGSADQDDPASVTPAR
jgi:hypothetical protein